ncbi:hypothetical protein [Mucilaginibacter sp. dw_454]|uniref:hypothetical protein n=1 Tax=Mucilaginibacter sp. dw_454 TaxID=2720079 RepID=UPI001BD40579|nr:hypothetical protein [Mucilaginibacter sp. dw_454]
MKKIFNYVMAFAAAATVFSACKPMDKTYSELGPIPPPTVKTVTPPTIASITLGATDYSKLSPAIGASTQDFFAGTAAAFANIPTILTAEFPAAVTGSQITVTYATSPVVPTLKLADSLNADVAHTLQTTPTNDYVFPAVAGTSITANNFSDFTATAVLNYLAYTYKTYQTPLQNNSIRVLTYVYFESGATPSSGTTVTNAFLFTTANGWQKIYCVSPAQYASVNRGTNNWFLASDVASSTTLPSYFNAFLKADASVMASIHVGDVINVSYKYLTTYQRVMPMAYDGTNFVVSNTTATNLFTLSNGIWTGQLDNTVNYTLAAGDYAKIGDNAATDPGVLAGATAIKNMVSNTDFTLNSATATSRWSDTQIANSLIFILKTNYTAPSANQKFLVTFKAYSQYTTETYTFIYDATKTAFVYQPASDPAKYTLTGDDYAAIGADNSTGATPAAMTNLGSFGDFSLSGASAWSQPQINAGIANVLKTRYGTTATAGQAVAVTYAYYSGSNQLTSLTFKFDGTKWATQ